MDLPSAQIANEWDPITIRKIVLHSLKEFALTFVIGGLIAVGDSLNAIHLDSSQTFLALGILGMHNLLSIAVTSVQQYKNGIPQSVVN